MKVRAIQPEDAVQCMELGEMFQKESPFHSRYKFNRDKTFEFMMDLALRDGACAYVCENGSGEVVGFVGGEMHSMYYTEDRYASEVVFYVSPKHRGGRAAILLLKEFEKWAKKHDAKDMEFGVVTGIDVERTDRFFKHYGFKYLGANFYKEIN